MEGTQDTRVEKRTPIPIYFAPFIQSGRYAVEKADTQGKKRKYLQGVSSGVKIDKHSERMTDRCVKSFMEQANAGNVLLYADTHGIKASDDIGILTRGEIQPSGDWFTEYRLYDENDPVDDNSKQKAEKIWRQVNGLPPYRKPMQKGFSIEGFIPEDGILSATKDETGNLRNRVIDNVLLDGVVLVPRPAYASVANAVYKALGELTPSQDDKVATIVKSEFEKVIESGNIQNQYFRKRWEINDALEKSIVSIMRRTCPEKEKELNIVFREYGKAIIPLILTSANLFLQKNGDEDVEPYGAEVNKASKIDVYKALLCELEKLSKLI